MELLSWWIALGGVFFFGVQTSISPCPLATNIAAVSYIGKRVNCPKDVFFSGLLYTAGRSAAYIALAVSVMLSTSFSSDNLIRFFQTSVHAWLGPVLILIGMLLLGLISISLGKADTEKMQNWINKFGLWSAFPIGIVFALAFCPTSAATFLVMIGLSVKAKSPFLFPALFGIGTALPVLVFALILAFQAQWIGKAFSITDKIGRWSRIVTGLLFIVFGIWFVFRYNFEIL